MRGRRVTNVDYIDGTSGFLCLASTVARDVHVPFGNDDITLWNRVSLKTVLYLSD